MPKLPKLPKLPKSKNLMLISDSFITMPILSWCNEVFATEEENKTSIVIDGRSQIGICRIGNKALCLIIIKKKSCKFPDYYYIQYPPKLLL